MLRNACPSPSGIRTLPAHLGPKSVNQHLILVRAALRFLWKRGRLQAVPYVPMESVPKKHVDWYTQQERDQLLEGLFRLEPQWYLFYYLTMRLGLRTGEVYAIAHRQLRREPPQLVVDQAVQRGTKTREARLVTRKNDEAYVLDLTVDILAAVDWHVAQGYGGPEFLFTKTSAFPRYIDSHVRPLTLVQRKLGLRVLSHHKVGRHSVASQAVTGGRSLKAVQAQLGHRSDAEHAPLRAPRRRTAAPARRGAAARARSTRAPWKRGVNGRCRSHALPASRQPGVNGLAGGVLIFSRTPCFLGCAGPIRSLEHGIFKEFVVALVA